jgi:DNA-binding protein YbaB
VFDQLKQLGDLKKMRDEAMAIQKQLQSKSYEVVSGNIKVTIRGDQQIIKIEVNGAEDKAMRDAVNNAIKKSQEMAAQELQGQMGGLFGK